MTGVPAWFVCGLLGHTGWVIPWGLLNSRPSNRYIFEHARCARCGVLRWPEDHS